MLRHTTCRAARREGRQCWRDTRLHPSCSEAMPRRSLHTFALQLRMLSAVARRSAAAAPWPSAHQQSARGVCVRLGVTHRAALQARLASAAPVRQCWLQRYASGWRLGCTLPRALSWSDALCQVMDQVCHLTKAPFALAPMSSYAYLDTNASGQASCLSLPRHRFSITLVQLPGVLAYYLALTGDVCAAVILLQYWLHALRLAKLS